ncbi:MAG: hypothetical protein A2Y18_07860 [Clostridiales bacterium GWD2_32_19]|nr:MAG: hypothetical protein A2Y18_07860 [Clostridiales bacterium GWD2_32_19]
MNESKIYSMLSLCQKAGKLCSGSFTCEKAIKSGKALLTIVAEDSAENTKKDFNSMCKYFKVRIYTFGEKEKLGNYIGKEDRTILCVTDTNFAKKIKELLGQLEGE